MAEDRIIIEGGGYRAVLFPEAGGALVTLDKGDVQVFWPCDTVQEAKDAPTRHGFPCLFPPNRLDRGQYTFGEQIYRVPMIPNRTVSCHGFLHTRPWQAVDVTANSVTMRFECTPETDFYPYYPHAFRFDVHYVLDEQGLHQDTIITNLSSKPMPIGVGWHTAFKIPFAPGSCTENVRARVSVGERIPFNERALPSGEVRPLSEDEQNWRAAGGQSITYKWMDEHFTNKPLTIDGKPFYGAILEDAAAGLRVVYEVDPRYKHWMIFNARAAGDLLCTEPQNWRVNAPNLGLPYEEAGLDVLPSGQTLRFYSHLRVEEIC